MFSLPADLTRAGLSVRQAETGDMPFQRALYASARLDAPVLAQWPQRERDAFLDMQFGFQTLHYAAAHPKGDFLIVERQGAPVGRLILDRDGPDWCLVDIALAPALRGQGLGTALLGAIQAAAAAQGAARINLHVELGNPAQALYARFGFTETESESGAHVAMVWTVS